MKKAVLIMAVIATVAIVACSRHKHAQCCKKDVERTEVKEKVEDAAKAVGSAVKTETRDAVDTVKEKAEAVKEKMREEKKKASEEFDNQKKKAGEAIVNAAEKVQKEIER